MGRRGRLRREAIQAGLALSYKGERTVLMREVIRLATQRLFAERRWGEVTVGESDALLVQLVGEVLPAALRNSGVRLFAEQELTRSPDWQELRGRMVAGVAAQSPDKFRSVELKGEWWALRKSKRGRKPTGQWVFCLDCGAPRWATPKRIVKRCRECWLRSRKKGA